MQYIALIFTLAAGIGVFLAGMQAFAGAAADGRLTKIFTKLDGKPVRSVLAGVAGAAAISSSGGLTAITIGLIGQQKNSDKNNIRILARSGLLTAAYVIIGANIGTTFSGLIVAAETFNLSCYLSALALAGIILQTAKNPKIKKAGKTLLGLGLIFCGLGLMGRAAGEAAGLSFFQAVFSAKLHPILLVLIGAAVTAIFQSSAAVNGIIILLAGSGLGVTGGVFLLLGTNCGSCATAFIAAAGRPPEAKTAALFQLLFNAAGAVMFTVILLLIPEPALAAFMGKTFSPDIKFQLAWFNAAENILSAVLFMPFVPTVVGFMSGGRRC